VKQTLKKGDPVVTTGLGKTKNWGNVVCIVTKRRGGKSVRSMGGASFPIEDRWMQMRLDYIHLTNDISFRITEFDGDNVKKIMVSYLARDGSYLMAIPSCAAIVEIGFSGVGN
jgi:hypothetical protein